MTNIKIVIGANFGDEGKGLMTDYFCDKAMKNGEDCIVVCSNGGAQRGHTVVTPSGEKHVFHHFGSGTLVGADTYLCEEYILNPMVFREEYDELTKLGHNPNIYVHRDCRWSTPYDMIINQIIEDNRGENRHGSCGMGIWETVVRCDAFYKKLRYIKNNKSGYLQAYLWTLGHIYLPKRLKELGVESIPEEWIDIIYSDMLIDRYIEDFNFMISHITQADDTILKQYQNVVFENGQGLLLDQDIKGYGEHTTPSNTGIKNAAKIIKSVLQNSDVEACYVTRTYMTRHGAGRFDTECSVLEINPDIVDSTNIYNCYQGHIRYGKIDVEDLLSRIDGDMQGMINIKKTLAITHMNETSYEFVSGKKTYLERLRKLDGIYVSDGMTRESVKIANISQART